VRGRGMNDYSRLPFPDLVVMYIEEIKRVEAGEDSDKLETLEAEVIKRIGIVREMMGNVVKGVCALAKRTIEVIRTPILIQQYEREIKRVEQLLKYTKHSKKRQEHERYLKWLYMQVSTLKR
jgi:hypothetical protein